MTGLPRVAAPATRALRGAGIHALEDLHGRSRDGVAALHGMGPRALGALDEALAAAGLGWG